MPSLTEIDRDLDKIAVDPARLAAVQHAARARRALSEIDRELAELGSGTAPRSVPASVDTEPPVAQAPAADDAPPSGQIDVPDDVLASSELPAVLALPPSDPAPPLSLDLDSGETPLEEPAELAPLSTTASTPFAAVVPPDLGPATETRALLDTGADDPSADLASLLGESDPMRDEGAVPLAPEIEPEPTTMFTAEDAERYSRPAPAMSDEDDAVAMSDVELDLDEMIELEEESPAAEAQPRPKTAPPPPPRTAPPPPPTRPSEAPPKGFLGKLLQRKP